jgi:hypothetical protein
MSSLRSTSPSRTKPSKSLTVQPSDEDSTSFVKVYLRIRPLNDREETDKSVISWQFNKTQIRSTHGALRTTTFDRILPPEVSQKETYDEIGQQLIVKCMEGYNSTIFAYGQTGSGKTFSMSGVQEFGSEHAGIAVRALQTVFHYIEQHPEREFFLRIAYMEIYNEEINDLLGGSASLADGKKDKDSSWQNLKILRNDPVKGAVIEHLTEIVVTSADQALEVLRDGEKSRQVAGTSMNTRSSRSHLMFRLAIESSRNPSSSSSNLMNNYNDRVEDDDTFRNLKSTDAKEQKTRVSYLNLVDLAGSERQKNANTTGKRLKEGASINKSLLNLGKVISKLSEEDITSDSISSHSSSSSPNRSTKGASLTRTRSSADAAADLLKKKKSCKNLSKIHIPFRNSKLTRILQSSLGGNASTAVLLTMTASPQYQEESLSTIKFGELCKKIKNRVKKNVDRTQSMLDKYRQEINSLREELLRHEQQKEDVKIIWAKKNDNTELKKEQDLSESDEKMDLVVEELETTKNQLEQERFAHQLEHERLENLQERLTAMQTALFNSKSNASSSSSSSSLQKRKMGNFVGRRTSMVIKSEKLILGHPHRMTRTTLIPSFPSIVEEDEEEGKYDDGHTFKITANPVVPADSSDDSDGNPLESIDVMVKRRQLKRIRALEKQIMLNEEITTTLKQEMKEKSEDSEAKLIKMRLHFENTIETMDSENQTLNNQVGLMETEILRLATLLEKREETLQSEIEQTNVHKMNANELQNSMTILRKLHAQNMVERESIEKEHSNLAIEKIRSTQEIYRLKEQLKKKELFILKNAQNYESSIQSIQREKKEMKLKLMCEIEKMKKEFSIQLKLNDKASQIQAMFRKRTLNTLNKELQTAMKKNLINHNIDERQKLLHLGEKKLEEQRAWFKKQEVYYSIIQKELGENQVAIDHHQALLYKRENLLEGREKRLIEGLSNLHEETVIAQKGNASLDIKERDLQHLEEENKRKERNMKFKEMTLGHGIEKYNTLNTQLIMKAKQLEEDQINHDVVMKDIEYKLQKLHAKEKEIELKQQSVDANISTFEEVKGKIAKREILVKKQETIAKKYLSREEKLERRIIEQDEREKEFYESHAATLQHNFTKRTMFLQKTIECQQKNIEDLKQRVSELLIQKKNDQYPKEITSSSIIKTLQESRSLLKKNIINNDEISSIRRRTYFGSYGTKKTSKKKLKQDTKHQRFAKDHIKEVVVTL